MTFAKNPLTSIRLALKSRFLVVIFLIIGSTTLGQDFTKKSDIYANYYTLDQFFKEAYKIYNVPIVYDTSFFASTRVTLLFSSVTVLELVEFTAQKTKAFGWFLKDSNSIVILKPGEIDNLDIVEQNIKFSGMPVKTNFKLSGKVIDAETGEALPFATVGILAYGIGNSTTVDGTFVIDKVPNDTVSLTIKYVGYENRIIYLSPTKPTNNLVITLRSQHKELQEVEIEAEREDILQSNGQVSLIKMSPKKLAELPNVGEKDIMRAFQLMPGVSGTNESSSGLYVRGGTPDQNLILYDGFTVYHVDHLYGFYSAFNSNAIKDVQLYKGGFDSKFGGRLSSVTEITAKDGNSKNFNIGGDISLLSINGYMEVPVGEKFTSLFAFRRSFKGPLYNKIFDQYNTATTVPAGLGGRFQNMGSAKVSSYFYDLNAKFTYRPTTKDVLSFSFYNGTDKLDNSTSFSRPSFDESSNGGLSNTNVDLTRYGNIGSSLKWSRRVTKSLYVNSVASFSNYYSTRERSNSRILTDDDGTTETEKRGSSEDNNLLDYSIKSDLEWSLGNFNKIGFGGGATYYDIAYSYIQNDTTTILNRHTQGGLVFGYLQDNVSLFKDKLHIIPGARISFYEITKKIYLEPRFNAYYNLSKKIKFSLAYGKYYQFANRVVREDLLSGSRDFWVLSDGDVLPVSHSQQYIAGISYENDNYLFSVESYYKDLIGLSEYSLRFSGGRTGISYDENFYTGKGYSKGIEFLAQKKYGKFNGWVSYTLSQTRNQFDVYGENYFAAYQDITNEFKVIGMYKHNRWTFSLTQVYGTGRPYTAPEGGYEVSLLDGSVQSYVVAGTKNSYRLPDYHRMDIAANFKILNTSKKEIGSLGLSIFNLYNRKNVWYKEYDVSDGVVTETSHTYLGITPNLTLTLKLR